MPSDPDRLVHALSEERSERVFRTRILPRYLPDGIARSERPTCILLGGQPGAGKIALLHRAERQLHAAGSTVAINGDDLRPFHPAYAQLQRTDPLRAAFYTDHDSGRWVERLIAEAVRRRVNLVIEGTMRRAEVVEATAGLLRSAGYRVEAHALAVSERLSWLGVHERYEAMLAAGGAGRFSAREAHDAAVSGMLRTLEVIEAAGCVDRVLAADREGRALYDNHRADSAWQHPPGAAAAVAAERARPLSAPELDRVERAWQGVIEAMQRRDAPAAELDRARDTAADIAHFRSGAGGR